MSGGPSISLTINITDKDTINQIISLLQGSSIHSISQNCQVNPQPQGAAPPTVGAGAQGSTGEAAAVSLPVQGSTRDTVQCPAQTTTESPCISGTRPLVQEEMQSPGQRVTQIVMQGACQPPSQDMTNGGDQEREQWPIEVTLSTSLELVKVHVLCTVHILKHSCV